MDEILPLVLGLYPLIVSGFAFYWLLGLRDRDSVRWSIRVATSSAVICFAFLGGPWAFTSYSLRYVVFGLYVVFVGHSYWRMKTRAVPANKKNARNAASSALLLVVFGTLDGLALGSRYYPGETVNLSVPFDSDTYYVLQGGNSIVTNPFHALAGNKGAVDIVKLNALGNRARGMAPRELDAYEVFGESVLSPCEGEVVEARGTLLDNRPGGPDTDHPEGNYVVLQCAEAEVCLGHLERGSVAVARGDTVGAQQPFARVGNSGNSLEPHLHIEARRNRANLGLEFQGRTFSVNSLLTGESK